MMNRISVLTFFGVFCLFSLTLATTTTRALNTTRPLTNGASNTTKPLTNGASNTTRPLTNGASNTTRPLTNGASNTTRPISSTTGITKAGSNSTYSSSYPSSSSGNYSHHNQSKPPHNQHSDEKLDHDVEKNVIKVLKLFEKILTRHHNKPGSSEESSEESSESSSEEESGEHGPHHGPNHEQVVLNNTYCSFGFILYTEFRKALDSQNISQIAQRLGINVTNSTELQKSGFAGLVELFSRSHPELNPFYEQCPGQVNSILANWAGSRTNNPGLNFTGVAQFPCTARAGRNAITYNWNNNTRSLQWSLSNSFNGSSNSSNQFNNQTSSSQNSTLPSSGSVSLQFIFDGIDYGYSKINSEPVITNFAAKYWVSGCPNWYNDLVEILKFSLVREAPKGGDAHRQRAGSETSESSQETSSSSEELVGRRGYGRRGYGRRGYGI